jgi:RNA polymerase sigma factor (sigma-70 family)
MTTGHAELSDADLLREFVRSRSDAAFSQIVRRYTNLAYAAARRQVRDAELAEDVTQAAFLVLARRASTVPPRFLAGWLLTTTHFCARDAIKQRTRRTHYEREAAMARPELQRPPQTSGDPQVAAVLDDALSRLKQRECTAIGLRYLQDKPLDDVAAALAVSPNAAQKIVARALIKLRRILRNRGIVLPSITVLTAVLLHESAQTVPASVVISSVSSSASSLSIAKGVAQMMFWTKIKTAIAITAATLMLAGTGTVVLRVMAETPAPQPEPPPALANAEPAPESVASYDSPFLELVGCRIKETTTINLTANPSKPVEVAWVEQQYPVVKWTIAPDLAAKVNTYSVSVASKNDPSETQTVSADKSALERQLAEQLKPGDYLVKVSALAADSTVLASGQAHIVIDPLPLTQIMITDITPDGGDQFTSVIQSLNSSGAAMSKFRFMNSDFVRVDKMTDELGRPIRFTVRHIGSTYQYFCTLNSPIRPGVPQFVSTSGTETGQIRPVSPKVFAYSMTHYPNADQTVRRIELYRLPKDATLIDSSPNMTSKVVDGRTQIFMEAFIEPGGGNTVAFRYRTAN